MKTLLISLVAFLCYAGQPSAATTEKMENTAEVKVVKDLNANTKPYIYYSLTENKEIPASEANTKNWDIAFSKTTIAVNSGTSGPGQGGALVVEQAFTALDQAPADGYKTDGDAGYAIPGGSGNSWYKYDMSVHAILPILGRTILVRTAGGGYAKVEIISYYKGAQEEVPTEETSYYTFRYALADAQGKF